MCSLITCNDKHTPTYIQPLMINATILNSMGVTGHVLGAPIFTADQGVGKKCLDIAVDHPQVIWPWSGYLALYIKVMRERKTN